MTVTQTEGGRIFLTAAELVKRWRGRKSLRTIEDWRYSKNRRGPKYTRIEGSVLYALEDIEEYERTHKI